MLTERQTKIMDFLRSKKDQTAKKSEIVNEFSRWYWCNASFYLSEILHRMVKKGLLIKPKHGFYKISTVEERKKELSKCANNQVNTNQIELF